MIRKAKSTDRTAVKNIWKKNYSTMDPRYLEYRFRNVWPLEEVYTSVREDEIIGAVERRKYALMFNGRVIQSSVLSGLTLEPRMRSSRNELELLDTAIDACEHSELLTLIQTENPSIYEPYGFRMIYNRTDFTLQRKDVRRITNFGCAYEPTPIDLLKVYSAFIRRFNGFYPRDLDYFVRYKKEVTAVGGKIVAYYDGKNQIRG
ncbi:MAG: GNAT family N-acetyltransferase, partial [Solobacterium sp.]|nr:GNAT family N-acetyltransferase [Solobacterium sp.]